MRKFLLFILLLGTVSAGAFYHYGRGIWWPVYVKVKGSETVGSAVAQYEDRVQKSLQSNLDKSGATLPLQHILLVGLKEERTLEVWYSTNGKATWRHLKDYPFTAFSGQLGPKLKEGDRQIPEGIYKIEYLNPNSSYHLSFKVDYPNAFDKKMAAKDGRTNLGGDIFIHGKAVTIGCIPVGDSAIEELFYLVATTGKENVDVIIAPYDMRKGYRPLDIGSINWEEALYTKLHQTLNNLSFE